MSTLGMVRVGTTAARTAIDTAAAAAGDQDAALMRVTVLEFLRAYADRLTADAGAEDLLAAYRAWLAAAVAFYASGDPDQVPVYTRAGALLDAEVELSEARAAGLLDGPALRDRG